MSKNDEAIKEALSDNKNTIEILEFIADTSKSAGKSYSYSEIINKALVSFLKKVINLSEGEVNEQRKK